MSEETEEEPSIEEILASIRQIISDDDEPQEEAAAEPAPEPEPEPEPAPAPEPEPEPEPAPEPEPEPEEDVLELTPEMQEPDEDIEIDMQEPAADDAVLSDEAKSAALASMAKLASSMPVNRKEGYDGVTVEDIVRELMTPVIREWADNHLGEVVEGVVQKEISKLTRRALDE